MEKGDYSGNKKDIRMRRMKVFEALYLKSFLK